MDKLESSEGGILIIRERKTKNWLESAIELPSLLFESWMQNIYAQGHCSAFHYAWPMAINEKHQGNINHCTESIRVDIKKISSQEKDFVTMWGVNVTRLTVEIISQCKYQITMLYTQSNCSCFIIFQFFKKNCTEMCKIFHLKICNLKAAFTSLCFQ